MKTLGSCTMLLLISSFTSICFKQTIPKLCLQPHGCSKDFQIFNQAELNRGPNGSRRLMQWRPGRADRDTIFFLSANKK
jgi:hypothetical protein